MYFRICFKLWENINKKPTLFEKGESCHFIIIYNGKNMEITLVTINIILVK